MKVGALTITLHFLDTPHVSEEGQERITILKDGLVAEYAIPCIKRGDLEALMLELSKMVQRDILLDT